MSVSRHCSDAAPMKNYVLGPKRSRGTTPLLGNWIMRCIAAAWLVSFMAFIFLGVGSLFLIPFFFYFYRGIQGVRFSTNSAVAYPPMSLPSTCQTQLGRAVLGSSLFVLIFIFFVRFLGIYMWKTNPSAIFTSGWPIPPKAEYVITVKGWWTV